MRCSNSAAPLRTKLVATIGPASAAPERLHELLAAGVDVCRINFSHGTLDEHAGVLRCIRDWSARHAAPIAVMGDLCGPKIRLRELPGGPAELRAGQTVQIARGAGACSPTRLTVSYERFVDEVDVGERVYIDDGLVRLTVTEFLLLQALAQRPGFVKSRDNLMDAAYDDQVYVDDRTIDSHIKRMRKKFRVVDPEFDAIETLYGVGYRYRE